MAARPIEASAPDIVGSIVLLPTHSIRVKDRLRPIDQDWAAALGKVMKADGQKTPIEVCRLPGQSDYLLVAGGHRLTGAQLEGIEHLQAIVVSADAAERRMREISENLWRKGLDPIDRASFIAELVALHKVRQGVDPEADGRTVSASARWQKALKDEAGDTNVTMTVAYGWTDHVASQLGFSKSVVERDLLLHRRLPASVRIRLVGHPILSNATQLRALAKLDEREQGAVIGLLASGEAKSIGEARQMLGQGSKGPKGEDDKLLSRFIDTFNRMPLADKKGALHALVGTLSPAMLDGLKEVIAAREAGQ